MTTVNASPSPAPSQLKRWPRLLLGMLMLLFAGVIYAWSILKAPLATEFGWSPAQLALNFTLTMCFFCLGILVSGLLAKKVPPRVLVMGGGLLTTIGFIASSRISGDSLIPLYIFYGVLAGGGIGLAYNAIISSTSSWFPDKRGFCTGCLMMCFGFSTLLLGKVASLTIAAPSLGWRPTYMALGLTLGAVLLAAGWFVKQAPANLNLGATAAKRSNVPDVETLNMVRRPSFWKLFLVFGLLIAVGSPVISFARDYALFLGAREATAVTLVGVLSIFNGLGRLLSGTFFDRFGLRATQYLTSIVAILGPVLGLGAALSGSLILGVGAMCVCGMTYGFAPTVTAAFSAAFYGNRNFSLNFGVLNLMIIPGSFAATAAGSLVGASGGYTIPFIMLLCFSLVGLLINLTIRKP